MLDFSNIKFVLDRTNIGEMKDFLPDDVSVVIAYNKAYKDFLDVTEMPFLTDINFIPFSQIQIPSEVVEFLSYINLKNYLKKFTEVKSAKTL